jgi:GH15 family glucan-1,4-alpha-glucosidase
MAWVAIDRAVKAVEKFELDDPLDRWRNLRDIIHAEVCTKGFDRASNSFLQYFGAKEPDASLLMIPLVGFLPPEDPRVAGTVAAIERELLQDGFAMRYRTKESVHGLQPGEGAFSPCAFWLADNNVLLGRQKVAEDVFKRMLVLCSDVGLIAAEHDPKARRLVVNFPQAFTHVGLINTAMNLAGHIANPAEHRKE